MTDYQALAKEIDALSEADLRLAEGDVGAAQKSSSRREDVMSIRVTRAELEEIMNAAAVQGRRVSDFVREAALHSARERQASDRWVAAPVAEALDQLVERIDEQRRAKGRPSRTAR